MKKVLSGLLLGLTMLSMTSCGESVTDRCVSHYSASHGAINVYYAEGYKYQKNYALEVKYATSGGTASIYFFVPKNGSISCSLSSCGGSSVTSIFYQYKSSGKHVNL